MTNIDKVIELWPVIINLKKWIANLKRAKDARKKESIDALRQLILTVRTTNVYIKTIPSNKRNYEKENELSMEWTKLGFELKDLGIEKASKKCEEYGKYWSRVMLLDELTINKIQDGMTVLELEANLIINETNHLKL